MPIDDYIAWQEHFKESPPAAILIRDQLALIALYTATAAAGDKADKNLSSYFVRYSKPQSMQDMQQAAANKLDALFKHKKKKD